MIDQKAARRKDASRLSGRGILTGSIVSGAASHRRKQEKRPGAMPLITFGRQKVGIAEHSHGDPSWGKVLKNDCCAN